MKMIKEENGSHVKKIAFIGTHGTGKTTLAHELVFNLKKRGIDADFLGEIARSCPFPINEEAPKKGQLWIIFSQILKELEMEEKCEVLVCDRSVLDNYCYYVHLFGESKILEPLIVNHVKTYNSLFKVPIRKGFLKQDKVRSLNPEFQKNIDIIMNRLLEKFKIPFVNLEEREDSKIINDVMNKISLEKNYIKILKKEVENG